MLAFIVVISYNYVDYYCGHLDHLFSLIVAIVAAAQVEMIIQQFDPWWLYYPLLSLTIQVDTVLDFIFS